MERVMLRNRELKKRQLEREVQGGRGNAQEARAGRAQEELQTWLQTPWLKGGGGGV